MKNPNIPADAAEMARLVRKADEVTAVRFMQAWGVKQRIIGERNQVIADEKERANAQG